MDKVKKFLEGYVQWLALALGVGFLGWMLYSYILQKPVNVAVGSTPSVAPSDVDKLVWEQQGQKLQGDMSGKGGAQAMDPPEDLVAQMLKPLADVSPSVAMVEPTPYVPLPVPLDQGPAGPGFQQINTKKIQSLPTAPAIADLQVSGGHSNTPVTIPPAAAGSPPAAAPAGNVVQAVDRKWQTIAGTISTAALADSFKKAGIDPNSPFSTTAILHVYLVREERNVDGTWGPETDIPPLDINPLEPLPPNNAPFTAQKDYIENFAEKNVGLICQPPFYQVLQGDKWYEPGTTNPNGGDQATQDSDFDPNNPLAYTGDPNDLLPDEKIAYDKAKADKVKSDALKVKTQNRPSNQPQLPPGFSGPPGFEGRSPAVPDPQRDGDHHDFLMPPRFPGEGGMPPGMPYGMPPGQPGSPQSSNSILPSGSFNPAAQATIKVWAHDPTVQAGKTYRYKLRYNISNPVARTTNLCANPAMEKQFYIESDKATEIWTDPVSVESDTNFYAVELKHGVHFDVFKWKNGIWQMQSVQVNPGDMVGSTAADPTGNKTDFSTGWTLVDIRQDPTAGPNNATLVLVSDNGTVLRKELGMDQHNSEHRRLYKLANPEQAKTASAGPGNPGTPPNPDR